MLWSIAIIFVLLWVLGLVTSTMLGGYIHVLIGVALTLLVVQYLRRPGHRFSDHSTG